MDRRVVAVGVFVVAAVALATVPGVVGRRTAGLPTAGPVPGPPAAATCLAPITTSEEYLSMSDLVPAVPCTAPHSAEIAQVVSAGLRTRPTGLADPAIGPATAACTAADAMYVGTDVVSVADQVKPRYLVRVAIPSQAQWNAGQRWYACEVMPTSEELPISFTGSAWRMYAGRPPAIFGTCALSVGGDPVSCTVPHAAEELASATTATGGPQPVLGTAPGLNCGLDAVDIIGVADATFGGRLSVVSWVIGDTASCWAQANDGSQLTNTLIDLGSAPLPLAGS